MRYILKGVMRFTIDVDRSTFFLSLGKRKTNYLYFLYCR